MSQLDKLIQKIKEKPTPKDFLWSDFVRILNNAGYVKKNGSGSRRKFYKTDCKEAIPIMIHEPHPQKTIKPRALADAVQALKDNGDI